MKNRIEELVNKVLDDVNDINDEEVKDRLPLEIMALNAVANAYDKLNKEK